jgi:hypothetical protein
MARPKHQKESLENIGVKVEPALKKAIEDESSALRIAAGTYARQLIILGWQSRHGAPVTQNPREIILINWFNELPIPEQENLLTIAEALHKKHASRLSSLLPAIPTDPTFKVLPPGPVMKAYTRESKKGGNR